MRIVTYNLRCDVKNDGVNSFTSRKGLVLNKIDQEMPDVIGFQEVTPPMNAFLHKKLSGYTLVGCGRGEDYADEHNPVAFRPDRYELIGLDVTWLSETPYAPGTRYKIQSICPRIITHVILRPLGYNAKPFHVYNTHLDHESSQARQQGAKRLLEKMEEDQKTHPFPALVTGDFNALPDAPEIRMIQEKLSDLTENVGVTFHNFGRKTDGQIDYIFASGFDKEASAVKWTDEWNGVFLSDHYPIECRVKRKDGGEV
ncbi:MAG: endonuclease/exonuclease/phosphatase family protein [Clostridia bacterium]|nr:endonuclease/exonuclease/phosphatase family protein [Clostridia bacterium]